MYRVIAHLDMDAFFASVEQRDDPALRGKPVIVGAPPTRRGVVCAASYEARKFGVRSAMPSATAGRLCPKGVFVRPRMARYEEESGVILKIMAATGAVIEPMSIVTLKSISGEETFLHDTDDRPVLRACLRGQAAEIAAKLKRQHLAAHTIQVKVRYGDFTTLTRQLTVEEPITEAKDMYRLACHLLGRKKLVSRPLRLLGLGVSNLREPTAQQLTLL